jgi:ABC-type lipoprotein release transport system permease subunit
MRLPYELQIGWRYTRAGRTTRRNGFISFISARVDARASRWAWRR